MQLNEPAWRWDDQALSDHAAATLKRIFAQCRPTEQGCLIWGGYTDKKTGYGRVGYGGHQKTKLCHRLVFHLAVRPLKPGEHVDHRCHNADNACIGGPTCVHRPCLEPSHLDAVTQAENNRRALDHAKNTPGSRVTGDMRGTCKKGLHPWIPENIAAGPRGTSICRACKSDRQAAYDLRTRGPSLLGQRPVNPVWASLGLDGCRECGSNQNGHKSGGLCHTCNNRRWSGAGKRKQRQAWLAA